MVLDQVQPNAHVRMIIIVHFAVIDYGMIIYKLSECSIWKLQ